MEVDQCCLNNLTAHFQPCPNLNTLIEAQDHDWPTFTFLLLCTLDEILFKHEKRKRNKRDLGFFYYVYIANLLANLV